MCHREEALPHPTSSSCTDMHCIKWGTDGCSFSDPSSLISSGLPYRAPTCCFPLQALQAQLLLLTWEWNFSFGGVQQNPWEVPMNIPLCVYIHIMTWDTFPVNSYLFLQIRSSQLHSFSAMKNSWKKTTGLFSYKFKLLFSRNNNSIRTFTQVPFNVS